MKKISIILAIVTAVAALAYYVRTNSLAAQTPTPATSATDYKNASYTIDGREVKLVQGVAEEETAPGSAAKIVTRYFGNEVRKDLDHDGREDVAFLLTQETGGSGTFFYAVAALNKESGYVGSHGYFLGDRIAPQSTDLGENNTIVVNYAERAPEEPMTAQPSVGKSAYLLLDPETMEFTAVEPTKQ